MLRTSQRTLGEFWAHYYGIKRQYWWVVPVLNIRRVLSFIWTSPCLEVPTPTDWLNFVLPITSLYHVRLYQNVLALIRITEIDGRFAWCLTTCTIHMDGCYTRSASKKHQLSNRCSLTRYLHDVKRPIKSSGPNCLRPYNYCQINYYTRIGMIAVLLLFTILR